MSMLSAVVAGLAPYIANKVYQGNSTPMSAETKNEIEAKCTSLGIKRPSTIAIIPDRGEAIDGMLKFYLSILVPVNGLGNGLLPSVTGIYIDEKILTEEDKGARGFLIAAQLIHIKENHSAIAALAFLATSIVLSLLGIGFVGSLLLGVTAYACTRVWLNKKAEMAAAKVCSQEEVQGAIAHFQYRQGFFQGYLEGFLQGLHDRGDQSSFQGKVLSWMISPEGDPRFDLFHQSLSNRIAHLTEALKAKA